MESQKRKHGKKCVVTVSLIDLASAWSVANLLSLSLYENIFFLHHLFIVWCAPTVIYHKTTSTKKEFWPTKSAQLASISYIAVCAILQNNVRVFSQL